jgi:hypothetical protein
VQQHRQGGIFQQLKSPLPSVNQNAEDIARAVVKAMADQNIQTSFFVPKIQASN